MFKVEIRNDSVHIDGYVNAVERDSKVLRDDRGEFIEKVKAGAFQSVIFFYKFFLKYCSGGHFCSIIEAINR